MDNDISIAMVAPLGTGKTYYLAWKCYILARINGQLPGLLVVPTYNMAKRTHAVEWPVMLAQFGIQIEWRPGKMAFEWPWGATTWVVSAENPQRLAGPNMAYVLYDEPGQMDVEAWERGSGRCRHPLAKLRQIVLGGTPEGLNWFADKFDEPKGRCITIRGNTWHPDMAHYPKQLVELYGHDDSLLSAYAKGMFVPLRKGRCYRFFDRKKHVGLTTWNPNLSLVLGCDFNVDHMSWVIMQISKDAIMIHDEIALGPGGSTESAIKKFIERYKDWKNRIVVCGDSSGKHRHTNATKTDYGIMKEAFRDANFEDVVFRIPKANPRQKDRIDRTNYHMSNRGRNFKIMTDACPRLVKDFERVVYKEGSTNIEDRDHDLTHASSASDYAIWMLAKPRALAPAKLGEIRARDSALGMY